MRICSFTYALYPATGEQLLKWKYGIEPMPKKRETAPVPGKDQRKVGFKL